MNLKNVDGVLFYSFAADSYGNNNIEEMWLKFTGCFREDEKNFIDELSSKNICDISSFDLERFAKIKRQMEVHELLPKYIERRCSEEEHSLVYDFVTKSLVDFIDTRITDDEKILASDFVNSLSKDKLKEYIDLKKDNYDELSFYDAYVLFIANKKYYRLVNAENSEKLRLKNAKYNQDLIRHLVKDYGML